MLQRIDKSLFVIFAWPILLLIINFNWIFTQTSQNLIDPWFYLGYFLNLPDFLKIFPTAYYASRLPWILPGYLLYKVFPPLAAHYILHLAFYYLSLLSIYFTLKILFNKRVALLTSLSAGSYIWFLTSIGWDYVDGAGNTYLLLTIMFLTFAISNSRKRLWLFFAGVGFSALIHTNLFLVIFTPFLFFYYFLINRIKRKKGKDTTYFFFGAVSLTVLLGAINTSLGGQFVFFAPTLRKLSNLLSQTNPWRAPSYTWLIRALWLVLPALTFLNSILFVFQKEIKPSYSKRLTNLFQLQFIALFILFAFMNFTHYAPVLQFPFYSSYLIPFMFLALGSQLATVLQKLKNRAYIKLLFFSVILLAGAFYIGPSAALLFSPRFQISLSLVLGLLAYVFINKHKMLSGLYIFFLLFGLTNALLFERNFPPTSQISIIYNRPFFHENDKYLVVTESLKVIKGLNPKAESLFWYDKNESNFGVYRAIASTYLWGARLVNEDFPQLPEKTIKPNTKIIIFSNNENRYAEGISALEKDGLRGQLIFQEYIKTFWISLIQVEK